MNQELYNFIFSVVSGLVTNGVQGVYDFVTKETLQDKITNTIESVQEIYEKEFECKDKSLFIWKDNIAYYTKWLKEGFLPREKIVIPIPYGLDKSTKVSEKEILFITMEMSRLVKEDMELRSLHASNICDEIYRMLARKEKGVINQDYYGYVESYGNVLFLHKTEEKRAITLKDTYVQPEYKISPLSSNVKKASSLNILELLVRFSKNNENRVMIIEGDAGVGKSSLISHLCYQNEVNLQKNNQGIFDKKEIYCVRLRNLTANKGFIEVPVNHIIEELGFGTYAEFEILAKQAVIVLDGFDELCMIDGMTDFAEYVLGEIIKGFSDYHIVITTRPKFLDISKLKEEGINTGIEYIILKHFDIGKRNEWIERYKVVCESEEYARLERISMIEDENSEGICDTPLALYMLAAGKITEEAWDNPWVLYNQIFHVELSNTEYNKLFSKISYSHKISRYKDILYKVSAEIAYKMYTSGNKKLYVTQEEIEEIINHLHLETNQISSLVKRCYALCNYWKNDGQRGMAEFYHNNIRDFFMCEKIFYELENIYQYFDEKCMTDDDKCEETIEKFIFNFGRLFSYSDFNDKVSEFIYYRSLYKMNFKKEEEFICQELKYQFLAYFFEKMFIHGAIPSYSYDRKRNLLQENINVLRCIVQIYRHIYEPYIQCGRKRLEWFFNLRSEMNEMEALPSLFEPVFIRTPVTISTEYNIPVAGYTNFNLYDMKKADLRYGMFNSSKFLSCNFSNTILVSTDFSNAVLKNCNFSNADFRFSSLHGADIKGCKFDNCNLSGTILPDGFCSEIEGEQLEHIKKFL